MKAIRRNLFVTFLLASGLTQAIASNMTESVTKVGNGDDGADLEALTPMTSGPLFDSRLRAIEKLKSLNIVGVPGLGLLIPELERTELFLAAKNVHPTGEQQGSLETSEDNAFVYARTFAEPYAATRFFPAAMGLTSDQLIALHIHEALHRSLSIDLRTDENIVMHLTMAMTSPGAHFDRIRQVANQYIKAPVVEFANPSVATTSTLTQNIIPRHKSRSSFGYELDMYGSRASGDSYLAPMHGLEFSTSILGFKNIGRYVVEPVLQIRMKLFEKTIKSAPRIGPTSFELQGRVQIDEAAFAGPFLRFTAKSFDDPVVYSSYQDNNLPNGSPAMNANSNNRDRDIVTLGAFYTTEQDDSYMDTKIFYSLPSTAKNSVLYKSNLSLTSHFGSKWGRFRVGGLAELHASEGRSSGRTSEDIYYNGIESESLDSFRLLVLGPEMAFKTDRFQFKIFYKRAVNKNSASLDDLGDIVDRGSGRVGAGTSLSLLF